MIGYTGYNNASSPKDKNKIKSPVVVNDFYNKSIKPLHTNIQSAYQNQTRHKKSKSTVIDEIEDKPQVLDCIKPLKPISPTKYINYITVDFDFLCLV